MNERVIQLHVCRTLLIGDDVKIDGTQSVSTMRIGCIAYRTPPHDSRFSPRARRGAVIQARQRDICCASRRLRGLDEADVKAEQRAWQ